MSEMAASHRGWTGETGLIDQPVLARHVSGAEAPLFCLAGPPGMVKALRAMLTEQSVNDGDIHAEEFSGY